MKKICSFLLCLSMVFALTGCFYVDTTTVVDTSDNIKMTSKMGFTKASVDAAGSEYAEMVKDMKLETINGTEYYTETQTTSTTVSEWNETYKGVSIISQNMVYFYADYAEQLASQSGGASEALTNVDMSGAYLAYTFTLTGEIKKTNGTVSESDNKTVTFELKPDANTKEINWYAYTSEDANPETDKAQIIKDLAEKEAAAQQSNEETTKDTTKPVIKGVKKNKTYKNKVTAYIKDNVKVKSIKLNKKTVKVSKLTKVKKGKYKGYYKLLIKTGKKKLTVKLTVTDSSKNKKSVSFKLKGTKKFIKKVKGSFQYK